MQLLGARVPKVYPFRSKIGRFPDVAHFRTFPLTQELKFQSAIKVFKFGRLPKK